MTTDRTAKLRWLTLAEAWLMMADKVANQEGYDGNGVLSYQYLQRENEGALSPFLVSSMANRRKFRRHRVLKEGKITNSEMQCLANVVIRDLSESGARVQLPDSQALPDDFSLYIVTERLLYPARRTLARRESVGHPVCRRTPHNRIADWCTLMNTQVSAPVIEAVEAFEFIHTLGEISPAA